MVKKAEVEIIKEKVKTANNLCNLDDLDNAKRKMIEASNDFLKLKKELEKQVGPSAVDRAFNEIRSAAANLAAKRKFSAKSDIVNAKRALELIILELKD